MLEAVLRFLVVWVAIGVAFDGDLAISTLDLVLGRCTGNPDHFVVISLAGHDGSQCSRAEGGPRVGFVALDFGTMRANFRYGCVFLVGSGARRI